MNILSKIKAVFSIGGKQMEINLKSAKIREGEVVLYPANNDNVAYKVKTKTVDLLLNHGEDIAAEDFVFIENCKYDKKKSPKSPRLRGGASTPSFLREPQDREDRHAYPIKKKLTFMVYEDEFELINRLIKESGYKRSVFLVASLQNAQKKSVQSSFVAECNRVQKAWGQREQEFKERNQAG